MSDTTLLGPWIRRFLLEHLVAERNLTANTQRSYRDAFKLLLPFLAARWQKPIERLAVEDVSTDMVRRFLSHLQESRRCGVATRNQRLAAVRALSRFVTEHSPEHVAWCAQICSLPLKKGVKAAVAYLEKAEMDALLGCADTATIQGCREHALLLFLYNSGARAGEAAQVVVSDLELTPSPSVRLLGKGRKERHCPLWPATARVLSRMITSRGPSEPVFLNRCSQPITRFGIHKLVRRCALRAAAAMPSLIAKRVSPHTIRHTTAVHLLRAGVDINTIRAWLGHSSLETTNVYAEIDLEMKAQALALCEARQQRQTGNPWSQDRSLMEFLRSL